MGVREMIFYVSTPRGPVTRLAGMDARHAASRYVSDLLGLGQYRPLEHGDLDIIVDTALIGGTRTWFRATPGSAPDRARVEAL